MFKMEFWDRDGRAISLEQWSALHREDAHRFVASTKVRGGEILSSWLGRDQSCSHNPAEAGKPLIFGTIFLSDTGEWGEESFSATLDECLAEHRSRVESLGVL